MAIIRDEETFGLMMIPLFVDWGIKRCNVEGCKNKPNTIITSEGSDVPTYALCEEHYQEGNTPEGATVTLVWDDFDAFKFARANKEE